MQGIVEALGHLEEVVSAGDDVPLGFEAQVAKQGDQAVQDLRHASSDGRGVDHLDRLARQRGGHRGQLINFSGADDEGVVLQALQASGGVRGYFSGHESTSLTICSRTPSSVLV